MSLELIHIEENGIAYKSYPQFDLKDKIKKKLRDRSER